MNPTANIPWYADPVLIFFLGFFLLMYFMMIRPQNKRQKALQDMQIGRAHV